MMCRVLDKVSVPHGLDTTTEKVVVVLPFTVTVLLVEDKGASHL